MFSSKKYAAGEVLFRQGQPGISAHIIKSGQFEVYLENGNKEQQLAVVGPGQIFGEMALLGGSGTPRTASVRALTSSEVINLSRAHLLTMFKGVDPILKHLVLTLVNRLKEMNGKIRPDRTDHVCEAFCRILTLLAKVKDDNEEDLVSVSFEEILDQASMILALDASDCAFVMNELEKRYVIKIEEVGNKRQVVFDPQEFTGRLTTVADEIGKLIEGRMLQRSSLIDVTKLADIAGVEQTQVLNKIGSGDFPIELVSFKKEDAESWLANVGSDFFTSTPSKKVITSPDQVMTFADIAFVKGSVQKKVFSNEEIGVFQWITLLKHETATEEFAKRILSCIPPRIGKEVRNELSQLDDAYMVDEFEFEELEEALVDFTKEVLEQKNAEG